MTKYENQLSKNKFDILTKFIIILNNILLQRKRINLKIIIFHKNTVRDMYAPFRSFSDAPEILEFAFAFLLGLTDRPTFSKLIQIKIL